MESSSPVPNLNPAIPLLDALFRTVESEELQRAVGADQVIALQKRVTEAGTALALDPAIPGSAQVRVEALYCLARQCISLATIVDESFDDGTLARNAESEDWEFGVSVAEVMSKGLAVAAEGLQVEPKDISTEILERLCLNLDYFAPHLFGGLCRLTVQELLLSEQEERLLKALQGICAWFLAAVGRVVGYSNFSGSMLWELASGDALWALVLAKGVLSMGQVALWSKVASDISPVELPTLQHTVLMAVLNFASVDVAFSADINSGDVSMAVRNTVLSRHRTSLATALIDCQLPEVLIRACSKTGPAMVPGLVSLLASSLQPLLSRLDLGGKNSPTAEDVLVEARAATERLSNHLQRYAGALWNLFSEVPAAYGNHLPAGFLQNCADLSYNVPPSDLSYNLFLGRCLEAAAAGGREPNDPGALVSLCFIASNMGIRPGSDALTQCLQALPRESRDALNQRCYNWRGPVQLALFEPWAELLDWPGYISAPLAPEPPAVASPPAPPTAPPSRGVALQDLVRDAPADFRCALDGQLMMDPVLSPHGYCFERVGLAHALAMNGGHCPITGEALSMETCIRQPELRRSIVRWVREHQPVGRAKPFLQTTGSAPPSF